MKDVARWSNGRYKPAAAWASVVHSAAGVGSASGNLAYGQTPFIGTAASFPPNPGGFHPRAQACEPGRLAGGCMTQGPGSMELEFNGNVRRPYSAILAPIVCYRCYVDTTIRNLDEHAYRAIRVRAVEQGRTVGELISEAIRDYLGRRPRKRGACENSVRNRTRRGISG